MINFSSFDLNPVYGALVYYYREDLRAVRGERKFIVIRSVAAFVGNCR